MWWRVAAVVLAFSLCTVLASTRPASGPRITETADRSVTIATLPCATDLQSRSSGFVLADELVVTVAHAIYDSRDFAVRDSTGRWHHAKLQHLNRDVDLAVLRVRTLPASPAPLRVAERGDPIVVLDGAASGTTEGQVLRRVRITTAIVGDLSVTAQRSGYELGITVQGGDSGAGVLDADANLVGLVFARSTRGEAAWAISASEIQEALSRRDVAPWTCRSRSNAELRLDAPER